MKQYLVEELINAIRNQLKAEERLMRSERIKLSWRIRKERLSLG